MITRIRWALGGLEKRLYRAGWLRRQGLCLPDFLGVGAQKAGTTWLYENLRRHPQIYLPVPKEIHYFDWNFHRTLRWYARHFEPGVGRIKGEITPGYSILTRKRIDFVHWLMPDVRLLLLIRNPMERAWSQALMNLVKKPRRDFATVPEKEFCDHITSARSVMRGDYLTIVDSWLSRYRPDQLLILRFEEIREQPRELLCRVFQHLGATTDIDWASLPFDQVIFQGVGVPPPPAIRDFLRDMYRNDLERIVERFGGELRAWQTW